MHVYNFEFYDSYIGLIIDPDRIILSEEKPDENGK